MHPQVYHECLSPFQVLGMQIIFFTFVRKSGDKHEFKQVSATYALYD